MACPIASIPPEEFLAFLRTVHSVCRSHEEYVAELEAFTDRDVKACLSPMFTHGCVLGNYVFEVLNPKQYVLSTWYDYETNELVNVYGVTDACSCHFYEYRLSRRLKDLMF